MFGGFGGCNASVWSLEMKRVEKMTNEELVALFEEISIAQSEALDRFETARFNRLYDRKSAVVDELHSRPGDQRRLLSPSTTIGTSKFSSIRHASHTRSTALRRMP